MHVFVATRGARASALLSLVVDLVLLEYSINRRVTLNIYHKISSISRTKPRNSNVSCILLRLSSLNPLKPGVKLRMKM